MPSRIPPDVAHKVIAGQTNQRGDHGPGSYLLSPEGHRHAPWSDAGCVIFVKLRQYAGPGRPYVEVDSRLRPWQASRRAGVEEKPLFEDAASRTRRAWSAGAPAPGRVRSTCRAAPSSS